MIAKNVVLLCALLTMGCTTSSQVQQRLNSSWQGKNTDEFFLRYGMPSAGFQLNDGRKLFAWGDASSIVIPGSSYTNINPAPYGGVSVQTRTTPSSTLALECGVQLVADRNGTIEQVKITHDTIGAWQISRCNEVMAP